MKEEEKSKLIYLACPYAHISVSERMERFRIVTWAARNLTQGGYAVFSPITHAHPIQMAANHSLPANWEFWKHLDLPILKLCPLMVIIKMDGWDLSKGLTAEVEFCREHNISTIYILPDEIPEIASMVKGWDYQGELKIERENV